MHESADPNLAIFERAVAQLGDLAEEFVFIGGCATGLLVTDPASPRPRPTKDVDAIVEVASLLQYQRLSKRLRALGFRENLEDGVICRWNGDDVTLDVMPTEDVLGFHNRWYRDAARHAQAATLPSGRSIRVVSSPYFVATKLEAFSGRGNEDFLASHDLEDIVSIVEGRPELVCEIAEAPADVRAYLAAEFQRFLADQRFRDALPGHLLDSGDSPSIIVTVEDRFREIAALGPE